MTIPTFTFALREDLKNDNRFIPTRATDKATGWDVRAAIPTPSLILRPGERALIPLGVRAFCPEQWWYELKPRSSTFAKKSLHGLIGTIDEDYEGEIMFACQYLPDYRDLGRDLKIEYGDAIVQIIPKLRYDMTVQVATNEELDAMYAERNASRGTGGFGSTGQ